MLHDILKLSVPERILMVEAIWNSIENKNDQFSLSEETKVLLDERLKSLKENPDQGIEWETLKKRIEDQF